METARTDKLGAGLKLADLQAVWAAAVISAVEIILTTTLGGRDFHCEPFYHLGDRPERPIHLRAHSDALCLRAVSASGSGPRKSVCVMWVLLPLQSTYCAPDSSRCLGFPKLDRMSDNLPTEITNFWIPSPMCSVFVCLFQSGLGSGFAFENNYTRRF